MSQSDIDAKIRHAARAEDTDLDDPASHDPGEESLREFISAAYRGKLRWLMVLTAFWSLAFFALAVFAGFRFFDAESTRDQIMWTAIFLFSMQAVGMLKQWHWMQMDRHSIIREVKRLELQVARLSQRSDLH